MLFGGAMLVMKSPLPFVIAMGDRYSSLRSQALWKLNGMMYGIEQVSKSTIGIAQAHLETLNAVARKLIDLIL
jgi:hypothetical protein